MEADLGLALLITAVAGLSTTIGSVLGLWFKNPGPRFISATLGFSAGVMLLVSFVELLASGAEYIGFGPAQLGFFAGMLSMYAIDSLIPHHYFAEQARRRGEGDGHMYRTGLLVALGIAIHNFPEGMATFAGALRDVRLGLAIGVAVAIHNIPEGLAVGIAFGALAADIPSASLAGAMALAVGIGIQNFPEGAAVAIPLRREGVSRRRSFWLGQASGMVEPAAGVLGAAAVIVVQPLLPFALAFAAGAMIYVVVEELIPTARQEQHSDFATMGAMLGFAVMMTLDVAFG